MVLKQWIAIHPAKLYLGISLIVMGLTYLSGGFESLYDSANPLKNLFFLLAFLMLWPYHFVGRLLYLLGFENGAIVAAISILVIGTLCISVDVFHRNRSRARDRR